MINLEKHFGICLFAGGILGFLLPQIFTIAEPFVAYFIMLALFLGFLRIDFAEAANLKSGGPKLLMYALVSTILLPILFFISSSWVPHDLRLGLFLIMATCAGANTPLIASFLRLRIIWATTFVIITSIGVTFLLPLLLNLLFGTNVNIEVIGTMLFLGQIIIFPAILSLIFRQYLPKLSYTIERNTGTIGTLNIALMLATMVAINQEYISQTAFSWLTIYALIGMFLVFIIRFFIGFSLPAKDEDERWTNGLMFTILNISLAALIALEFFSPAVFWVTLLAQIPWILTFPAIRFFRNKFKKS